ncbi:MAG: SMC family ATPase, partial [Chloroflexi bacterium]
MIPLRLELKNFLPYRSPDPIRFEGLHLACLVGHNGAGKSSILDAITYALWGRTRAKKEDDLIHMGQKEMMVQLDFEQEGVIYRVVRRRGRRKTGSLNLFVINEQGDLITLDQPSMRGTQQKIEEILRLDYETFIHSAFLQQGQADAFTTKNPAERKRILANILGLERWRKYEDEAKERLKAAQTSIHNIEGRITQIDEELAREPGLKKEQQAAEKTYGEALAALETAQAALEEYAHVPGELKRAQQNFADLERQQADYDRDLREVEEQIERNKARIAEYEAVLEQEQTIEQGYEQLQQARETDAVLREKLLAYNTLERQYQEVQRKLQEHRAELEAQLRACEAQIAELERDQTQDYGEQLAEVIAEIESLERAEQQRDALTEEVNELEQEKARLETEWRIIESEGKDLSQRIATLEQAQGVSSCPLCGQPLSDEHYEEVLKQLKEEREEKRNRWKQFGEEIQKLAETIQTRRKEVDALAPELKRLSALRETAGSLQAKHERATDAQERLLQVTAERDHLANLLEQDNFAPELRQELAQLTAEREQLGYDEREYQDTHERLQELREFEKQYSTLEVARNSMPQVVEALEGAEKRLKTLHKVIHEKAETLEKLEAEIAHLQVLEEERQRRETEVQRLRTAERSANERLTRVRQQLAALESQKQRRADLEQRLIDLQEEAVILAELRDAFGKNGVQAMIIESAIPELESTANRLLAQMTDGRMQLRFSTQREKTTGELRETLDIEIADELGTRNYEMYSGGEAFRINFAIRIALSQMLARRAGAHLRTLFIDEGFGTQ